MGTATRPVSGPNDHNLLEGALKPGLGDEIEGQIRAARGQMPYEEPPDKAALRRQHEELKVKTKQLSAVERELEKERALLKAEREALDAEKAGGAPPEPEE